MVLLFILGWFQIESHAVNDNIEKLDFKISVVVACKNEENNLPAILQSLENQTFANFELIVIDDHSTDDTEMILNNAKANFANMKVLAANGNGKKNALYQGIVNATGNLIITTDADCVVLPKWIETIASFQEKYDCDMIISPVNITDEKSLFSKIQKIDFISLIASTAGACGLNMPIMCNGANLAFKKAVWLEQFSELRNDIPSGDDIFLLQSLKKEGKKIKYLKANDAIVYTKATSNLRSFLKQRKRWAGKSPAYTDWQIIVVALTVLSISAVQVGVFFLAIVQFEQWYSFFVGLFAVKYFVDVALLYSVKHFFKLKNIALYSFLLSLFYPFYIVTVALNSLFTKEIKWK